MDSLIRHLIKQAANGPLIWDLCVSFCALISNRSEQAIENMLNGEFYLLRQAYISCLIKLESQFSNMNSSTLAESIVILNKILAYDLPKNQQHRTKKALSEIVKKENPYQKFQCGDLVFIAEDLGKSMFHFRSGIFAIINYTYAQKYGGDDYKSYDVIILPNGNYCAWYKEHQLRLTTKEELRNLKNNGILPENYEGCIK